MVPPRQYTRPQSFKTALNDRLPGGARRAYAIQRLLYERFAVRLAEVLGDAMILKGGFMLELRLSQRRTTRDIDLAFWGDHATLLERLQEAGRLDKGDWLRFEVVRDPRGQSQGPVQIEEFKVTAYIGEDTYGRPFDSPCAPPLLHRAQGDAPRCAARSARGVALQLREAAERL